MPAWYFLVIAGLTVYLGLAACVVIEEMLGQPAPKWAKWVVLAPWRLVWKVVGRLA